VALKKIRFEKRENEVTEGGERSLGVDSCTQTGSTRS
jgi:hypothetical protein